MSNSKIYPKGIMVFAPNQNAPEFIKGSMVISINQLVKFCKDNEGLLSEYKGEKQLRCQLLEGNNGLYVTVDTWKPSNKQQPQQSPEMGEDIDDGMPF